MRLGVCEEEAGKRKQRRGAREATARHISGLYYGVSESFSNSKMMIACADSPLSRSVPSELFL